MGPRNNKYMWRRDVRKARNNLLEIWLPEETASWISREIIVAANNVMEELGYRQLNEVGHAEEVTA